MKKLKKFWPFIFIFVVWIISFWPFFRRGLLPIPADIITGLYYPWLDYKWGYAVGVPVKNPLLSDVPSILYPWRSLAIDELKSFHWPLWNPYYFAGMPLLANFQSAVFSYVNLFFLFLPKVLAWSAGVMTSPLLTMLAMYIFLRHQKLNEISSLLGSIVFSLSGFEIAWLEYNVHGHTMLFLPLLLLTIDKIFESKTWFWKFLLPIFIAFQIFAGYMPVVIYTYLICFFYILYFYFFPQMCRKKINWQKFWLLFFLWIWGLSLAAIQIFPGFELTRNSVRAIDPTVEASNASYLPFKNLITALAPDFFGNPATGNYFGTAFYDNFFFFIGTGTLLLVIFSFFFLKKEKKILFWWLVLLFSFVLVFENPLGKLLEKILFLSGGVAAKALFITDFSLVMLAGFGLEAFLVSGKEIRSKIIFSVILIAASLALVGFYSFRIGNQINRLVAQRNLVIPTFFFISGALVLLTRRLTRIISVNISGFVFTLLVVIQLLYSAKKYLPFSKREMLFPKTPVIDFLLNEQNKNKEPFRVEIGDVVPQNFLLPYGLETSSGYDALLPKRTGEFLSLIETGKVQEKISRVQLIKNYDSPLFPLSNTKYILVKKMTDKGIFSPEGNPPEKFKNSRYKLVFEDKTVQVYKDSEYFPRAFWVYNLEVAKTSEDFIKLLEKGFDFRQKVILEESENILIKQNKPKFNKIKWREDKPLKKILEVESDQPGYVFLADSFNFGWKAYVDGQTTKIKRANFAFQTIQVSSGRHLINIFYQPNSFFAGMKISLISVFLYFLICLLDLVRKLVLLKKQ